MLKLKKLLSRIGSYLFRVLIAIDQLCNVVLLGGDPDHTISGRVGYRRLMTNKWYWVLLENIIDTLFFFDYRHCYTSIEWDRVKHNASSKQPEVDITNETIT